MVDDRETMAVKEVNGKKQSRIPDDVIEELNLDPSDESANNIEFLDAEKSGEVVIKRLDV